ncbi:unnamed protein product [Closterium sp. NIES-53]
MSSETSAASISSTGLACLFDAHSLRWRLVKLRHGGPGPGSNGDWDAWCTRQRSSCHRRLEEPCCPPRGNLWTTDDPPRLATDDPPRLATGDPPRLDTHDPPRHGAARFLSDDLMGMEQLSRVVGGAFHPCCSPCSAHAHPDFIDTDFDPDLDPHSSLSFEERLRILQIRALTYPPGLHTRFEQLLSRHQST